MHRLVLALLLLLLPVAAPAAPESYVLEPEASTVAFTWAFGKDEVRGRMPISRADIVIDFDDLSRSRVDVVLDVARAEAGFPFASQAMKGPKVLDAGQFGEITFTSSAVRAVGNGRADIDGALTVRGVTRPATLDARLYRQRDTEAGDLSRLSIQLSGTLSRSDFGATGWSDMVGDAVRLDIVARIRRAP